MKPINQSTAFGLAAKDYQKYRRSYGAELYRLLFSLLPKPAKGQRLSILDIGCGTGKSTEPIFDAISASKVAVVGIDPDGAMLDEARASAHKKKLPIVYIEGGAEDLPFEKDSFDAAIAGAAFHWFGTKSTIKKILGTIKPGGAFMVFWVQYAETDKDAIGEEVYEKYSWKGIPKSFRGQDHVMKLLSTSGFKEVTKTMIPFKETQTIPEAIGLQKTNSSYILLSEKDKKGFVRDMTAAYKKALGKAKTETNDMELRIVYGKK